MNLVILWLIFYCQVSSSVPHNDTQCIENPTGEVSLNVAVRGVPGPEGPQGHKGDIGLQGVMGLKGIKGSRGIQGVPGPVGSVGLPGPLGQAGRPGSMGAQGEPGDTVLSPEEFDRITNSVHVSVSENVRQKIQSLNTTVLNTMMSEINAIKATLSELKVTLLVRSVGYLVTGEKLPTLTLTKVIPVQLVFVQSPTQALSKGHVEGQLTLVVLHFNSHLTVTTPMYVVE